MKTFRWHIAIGLALIGSLHMGFTGASFCKKLNLEGQCSGRLNTFTYSKGFDLSPEMFHYGGEKIKFAHLLSKGNTYVFTLCDASMTGDQLVLELFNKNGQMLATNYNKVTKQRYSKVFYPCRATGVYTMKFSFLNMDPVCASSVLGFQLGIKSKKGGTAAAQ